MQRIKSGLFESVVTVDGTFREGFLEEMTLTLRYEQEEASETNARGRAFQTEKQLVALGLGMMTRKDVSLEQSGEKAHPWSSTHHTKEFAFSSEWDGKPSQQPRTTSSSMFSRNNSIV